MSCKPFKKTAVGKPGDPKALQLKFQYWPGLQGFFLDFWEKSSGFGGLVFRVRGLGLMEQGAAPQNPRALD